MIKVILTGLAFGVLPTVLPASTQLCEGSGVSVSGQTPKVLELTCEAVNTAQTLFSQCNVPPFSTPLEIEILEEIDPGCVGQYHCGEQRIEVLSPGPMQEVRNTNSVFGFLPINEYFQSVIVHELAHASYDNVPCPLVSCRASHEYVAYAFQIMSLSPPSLATFESSSKLDRYILNDDLNAMVLFLAPDSFIQKVWTHLTQQDDPCSYIGRITEGEVFFDRVMP